MKKKLAMLMLVVPVLVLFVLVGCGSDEPAAGGNAQEEEATEVPVVTEAEDEVIEAVPGGPLFIDIDLREVDEDNPLVEFYIEDHGLIVIELFPEYAPITVENFISLIEDGFYDGLTFHRIIAGFMMQGGCPEGSGFSGSGEQIIGEFADNGIENPIRHRPGVLSMARAADFNGASSQFFIMDGYAPHLDGVHAAFGRVVDGMDVVESVIDNVVPIDGNGSIDPEDQPVIREARVVH
ncbi:MAG: peptidylprolyl isomerase [Turicibacter sp.]|nr:peptidylprolyl isomerase [Turicibacter sp.]